MARLIAIAGGIGSGKSIVSQILRVMRFKVYDCDKEARALMDRDEEMKSRIERMIAADVILADRTIDRRRLAEIVFADEMMLATLNGIVHEAVREDIMRWKQANAGERFLWVESAIIYESGIDRMVDEVWEVSAPVDLRVERVMARNSMSRDQVMERIEAQSRTDFEPHRYVKTIVNDGIAPVLPQVLRLLSLA